MRFGISASLVRKESNATRCLALIFSDARYHNMKVPKALMLLLWQNGVHVDDTSFAGCGRGYAGCGLTSAWFRSGWGRFDGRGGGGAHQGQGGDSVDGGDGGPDCCRIARGAVAGDRDDVDGDG